MINMKRNTNTIRIAQYAVLIALMLILAFTPLGYIKIGIVEITPMMLPVALGAIVIGPVGGLVLGSVFGLTSFVQCFGMSPFGALLLGLNPFGAFFTCFVPRALMGYLVGIIFKALFRVDRTKIVSFAVANLLSALLNTLFFVGSMLIFYWNNDAFVSAMADGGLDVNSGIIAFFAAFVGINGIAEAIFALVVGTAVSKPIHKGFSDK